MGLEATHWPPVRLPELYRGTGRLERVSDALPYDADAERVASTERVLQSIPFEPGQVPDLFPTLADDVQRLAASRGVIGAAQQALGE